MKRREPKTEELLIVSLEPSQYYEDDHSYRRVCLPLPGLDNEERNMLIAEEFMDGSGFGEHGLSFNKKQAKELLKELNKFLEK